MSSSYTFSGSGTLTSTIVNANIGSATEITIEGYDSIGVNAFYNKQQITSISINDSVTSIGNNAFILCTGLTSLSIASSVTSIGISAFYSCTGLTSISIPNSVTNIGSHAFYRCSKLTSVSISDSIESIADNTFEECTGLTSLTIPNSVTSIGISAFSSCTGLTSLTIPNSVTNIGEIAFGRCTSLTSVTIPNSVTTIGVGAFNSCTSLTSVSLPNSLASIASNTFAYCNSLSSITIPSSVTSIGNNAFEGCSSLTSISISNSIATIGTSSFKNCTSLSSISMLGETIGFGAFENCSNLTSITFSDNLISIGDFAFIGCSDLASISIPTNVETIGKNAFASCPSLTSVTIKNPSLVTSLFTNSFTNVSSTSGSSITFENTSNSSQLFGTWQTIAGYYQNVVYVPPPPPSPTITNFSILPALYGSSPITITDPSSNSSGAFSYSSSDPNVADISGNILYVHRIGTAVITATQEASDNYSEGTSTTSFSVFCFNKGTNILSVNETSIAVENIKLGDLIKTYKHGYKKVAAIHCGQIKNNIKNPNECMYCMKSNNLIVTGGHSMLVDSLEGYELYKRKMIKAMASIQMIEDKYLLLAGYSKEFEAIQDNDIYTYYHFMLENNGNDDQQFGVWANGVLMETPSKNQWIHSL